MTPTVLMYWILALFLIACHSSDRSNPLDPELTPPVQLQVAVDDTAGTATLTWTQYVREAPFGWPFPPPSK